MKKFSIVCLLIIMCISICLAFGGCQNNETPNEPPKETPKEYSNEVQVILLLGQSNGEGHTHTTYLGKTVGEDKNAEYTQGYSNVKISYACTISENTSNGEFVPVKLGQGHSKTQFGPEIGIAEQISAIDPVKPVYIIKYAYGGTTLTTQWRSPSSKNTGSLYTGAVNYALEQCKKLEEADLYPVIKAICWMQGESDSDGLSYNSYEQLERNFVADIRSALAYYKPVDGEIGFIDAGISDSVAWTHYDVINGAKQKLAQEGVSHVYLDTIAEGLRFNGEPAGAPDIYHYDSASMVKLGDMFATALLENFLEI